MGDRTGIEWTDATWTPIRARLLADTAKVGWHCEHVSEGCRNCYAEAMNRRLGTGLDFKPGHRRDVEIILDEKLLLQPLRWKRPRLIFVCSMTDLFADFVPDGFIDRMFAVMALCPQHTFQVLTKRPARMRAYLSATATPGRIARAILDGAIVDPALLKREPWPVVTIGDVDAPSDVEIALPLPNVWLGTSIEDRFALLQRVGDLRLTPAAVRFFSCEPLIGDLGKVLLDDIHWVIVGGESGKDARPMHPDWARQLRDQCAAAGVPFTFKQWGRWVPFGSPNVIECSEGSDVAWPDGSIGGGTERENGGRGIGLRPMAKKAAGRLLDGVLHDGRPA